MFQVPGARATHRDRCRRWERSHPGLVVHEQRRLEAETCREIDGIAVVRARARVFSSPGGTPPNYVEAVIHASRRKRLVTYASTHATSSDSIAGPAGRRGDADALERWNPANAATESEMETLLFQTIARTTFPNPCCSSRSRPERPLRRPHRRRVCPDGRSRRVPVDAGTSRRVPGRGRRPAPEPDPGGRLLPAHRSHRRPPRRRRRARRADPRDRPPIVELACRAVTERRH